MSQISYLDYKFQNIRPATPLTTGYVAATILGAQSTSTPMATTTVASVSNEVFNQLVLYVDLTLGGASASLKVEFSNDNVNYYQETSGSLAAGTETDSLLTHSFTVNGKYRLFIPIRDRYVKVSVLAASAGGNMQIDAITGVN